MYLSHRAALIDYATPILGSRDAAEDIVQDAYLRFMPARLQASTPEQTLGFLYRIVRNLAFDVLKRRKVETRETSRDVPFWTEPQATPTPEQQLLLCDQVRIVTEVLAGLTLEARVAVEMHRFGGFTLEQVASHLGISITTAHRHVRSAMLQIAVRLDRDDG
ncbi:DNA-directed RNA polymerase sigma-70 factor [Azorhizobium oxalatiphilum]|uniref:DNA-directed RNA polymerase sigma-70 factor n=1 Tax=Azorhizobium oxalatiphilum TaxID=980631 RepID=A0A917C5U4_9HYPH|nr:DNA-directed RNA polymerase sigma-70 factor [Azorhizobium oxalatiphilum]